MKDKFMSVITDNRDYMVGDFGESGYARDKIVDALGATVSIQRRVKTV